MDELSYWQDAGMLCSLISVPIYNLNKKLTCKKQSLSLREFIAAWRCLPEPHLWTSSVMYWGEPLPSQML